MRMTLLISATWLAFSPAAFAQAPADSGLANDMPAAAGEPAAMAPAPRYHHHRAIRAVTPGEDGQTWAHEPGTGMSGPASQNASNTDAANTKSAIAPHLPMPAAGDSAGPVAYLQAADRALAARRTGEAQQALEMAETRLLDRSTPVDQAGQPDQGPQVQQVSQALKALGDGDLAGARSAVQAALARAPQ
jgi:hypothetical protein